MRNNKINSFLDGFLYVIRPSKTYNSFNAKINNDTIKDGEVLYKLGFCEMFKRFQDYELANASGNDLTFKVKTHLVKGILSTDKVVIDNIIYSIIYLDEDKQNRLLYFYLEEDRMLDE